MIIKFLTVLSWIIGLPCLVAFIVCVLGRILMRETRGEQARTEECIRYYLKGGIVFWAWLIARYCL